MKTIKRADGKQVGKFKEADLEILDDCYRVLGTVYPYSALGEHTIVDYVEPPVVPEPIPVPQTVSMRQARLALLQAGKLSAVNSAISSMPGAQGDAARIEWEFSSEVRRNQPLVTALTPVLGMTSEQLDQLFILAAGL